MKSLPVKKGDIMVIAGVLLAALLGLVVLAWPHSAGAQGVCAEVYLAGELVQSIALAAGEQEIRLESAAGYNLLHLGPQGVRILEADCHNQDCVRAGLKTAPGAMIACLPHRLLILLTGLKDGDLDAIAR